jgi:hypothetical protein
MSERAIVDVRVFVEAETREDLYRLIGQLVRRARDVAPSGCDVRYSQLQRARGPLSKAFAPTIEPGRKRDRLQLPDELERERGS